MPCNSYGPNDNYNSKNSHFFAALIKKIYKAKKNKEKTIVLWGTGRPKRELIYVEDIADACLFFMNKKTKYSLINIGTGKDKTILPLWLVSTSISMLIYVQLVVKENDFV